MTHRLRFATSRVLAMTAAELAALEGAIQVKAYAGVDPATGKPDYRYDQIPAGAGKREADRICRDLDAKALELAEGRRARRKDPAAERPRKAKAKPKTIGETVEKWWEKHGAKLDSAPKTRPLIDGIILPNLGDVPVALVAGTPPDDEEDRDPDLVYLSERWEAIAAGDRKVRPDGDGNQPDRAPGPLKPSVIHRCHGIVGAALRRVGHPISDPGLPSIPEGSDSTPLTEEMEPFLDFLGTPETVKGYTVTRQSKAGPVTYEVPARAADPSAMDLITEAVALLVMTGPRPVEAMGLTRDRVDLAKGRLSLDGRGVVLRLDEDGVEGWVVAEGESDKRRKRVMALDPRTAAALKRWLTFQDEMALAAGGRLKARALVFSLALDASEVLSPKVVSKSFARAVKRAREAGLDLPDGFHFYDMRHYGISTLLRDGRDVTAVAKRFGTSARMIHQTYGQCIDTDDSHLAETFGALWKKKPEGDVIDFPGAAGAGPSGG